MPSEYASQSDLPEMQMGQVSGSWTSERMYEEYAISLILLHCLVVNQKTVIKSNSPPLGGHVQQSSSPLDSDNVDDCDIKDERSSSADDRTTVGEEKRSKQPDHLTSAPVQT